jgi:predicted phage terminase large subunit-like protein
MAYIDGKWLARQERQERITLVAERAKKLQELYETGEATEYYMDTLLADIDELEKLKRVHRSEYDMLYFMYEYFSEEGNPGNPDNLIPAGVTMDDAAEFHQTLCGLLDDITTGKEKKKKVAWSVGRGHAKTAYLSNGYLCHQVVYRLKQYIVLISETSDVAGDFISWARDQLKYNEKLREDFGILLHEQKSRNEVDNDKEFVTLTNTKVEAKGIGTQVRGLRHGSKRVQLYILDDLESKENTATVDLIAKNKRWFKEELLPGLSRQEGACIYMGTIVCYDSLLHHVIKNRRDFVSRSFPAILKWSEREDLWQEWREIRQVDDPDSADRAREFYEQNKEEMLRGTKTLWPSHFPYIDLMEIREDDGTKAFNQEYLCNPTDEERQIFKPKYFTYCTESDLKDKQLLYYGAVDFAMGKEKGDYSVVVTLAKNVETGTCYVIDIFMERVHPNTLLEKAVEYTLEYQYESIAVEAQQAQEWFAEKVGEALQKKGYPSSTRLKQIKQRTRKALRIESLLPDIQSGKLRFMKHLRALLEQFEMYPMHPHDDGPDAVQMAFSIAYKRARRKAGTTGNSRY